MASKARRRWEVGVPAQGFYVNGEIGRRRWEKELRGGAGKLAFPLKDFP